MIKIFIVDDHALFRQGLKEIFNSRKDIKIVGEAPDSKECLKIYRKIRPDIILMDISLPDKDGLETTKEILKISPKQKVIVLSMYDDEKHIFEAFQNGAVGYFVKTKTVDELFKIINAVYEEGTSVPRSLTSKLLEGIKRHALPRQRFKLTDNEIKILQLLKQGLSNKEIARQLTTSEKTIKNHLTNIFQKLAVENRTQAIVKIVEEKII
ncbi:MAG: response regulator transcription factor [Elusimicrobiota bacterium]